MPIGRAALSAALSRFPSLDLTHAPTPIEPMPRLGAELGIDLHVKRDDLTGIGFGGNKVRQLDFYLGKARAEGADTVLITGAVQSNFARTAAAMARRLGMAIHIQLEERVPDVDALYRENGNVLLDRLLGATLHSYPEGEDEAGADVAIAALADRLTREGRRPFIVPLSADRPPLGALGYVTAAVELLDQDPGRWDAIVVGSGSALTHTGLLFGFRALGDTTPVQGICVRRDAASQAARVRKRCADLAALLDLKNPVSGEDVRTDDNALAPGYGRISASVNAAIRRTAETEGLFLDPVYTGKVMAGLIGLSEKLRGLRVLFWHTGGQPALFGYGAALLEDET